MKVKRILIGFLAVAMLLSFAGCGESDSPKGDESSKDASVTESGSETAAYQLPAGAGSPYELYQTVMDYLNHGSHDEDLNDVIDQNLSLVFSLKQEDTPERNFISGMKYDESCALVAKLIDMAEADMPLDEDGDLEDDLIDVYQFKAVFPEEKQAQINENYDDFEIFIENIYAVVYSRSRDDGRNPFHTDQTEWEVKSESELEIEKYRHYDSYEDLYSNFPQVYEIDLGEYRSEGDVYGMRMNYAKIGSRYYFLSFGMTWW